MGETEPVVVLSLILAKGRAPLQSLIMLAFAVVAFVAVVSASRIRDGYFAGLIEQTMGTSGQLPMRLVIAVLILLAVLSRLLDIDMVLGAFVAGAIARSALAEEHQERGAPALLLYRRLLDRRQRLALAFHLSTQISLVVPIAGIAVERGFMEGAQGAALVGAAIVTTLVFPALAARCLLAAKHEVLA